MNTQTKRIQRLLCVGMILTFSLVAYHFCRVPNTIAAPSGIPTQNRSSSFQAPTPAPSFNRQLTHPRIFFQAQDIAILHKKATSTHQAIWQPIQAFVQSIQKTPAPSSAPPDGELSDYRNYGDILIPSAFACVITKEDLACQQAKSRLLTYASWNQWGEHNYRDLGLAHMLMGNAIAYDWLYGYLTPNEQTIVRHKLADWAQKMDEASMGPRHEDWENWWRRSYIQNHHWINNSALGMVGLVLLGEDERSQTWIDHATSQLSRTRDILNGIGDGSWHEGIHYQSYGLATMLPFLINLRTIQGTDIVPHTYLQNYPFWRLYNHLSNGQYILSYGDIEWEWENYARTLSILRFTAHEYHNGYAEWVAQHIDAQANRSANVWATPSYVFEFFSYDPTINPQSPHELRLSRLFPDLAGVIWRTGWGKDELVFGLKTGPYGGRFAFHTFTQQTLPWDPPCPETGCKLDIGHDHADDNGFTVYRAGAWLAPEREGNDYSATMYHNTLLIDHQGQYQIHEEPLSDPATFTKSDSQLNIATSTTNFDYLAANATQRYAHINGIKDVTRKVLFVRPNYFLMLDTLAATTDHTYEWVCHFGKRVAIEERWIKGESDYGQILGVAVITPQAFTATTGHDGKPYVRIQPTVAGANVHLTHLLYPTDKTHWKNRPRVGVREDSPTAIAIRVTLNDEHTRTDDILITHLATTTTIAIGDHQYNGQVAVITRGDKQRIERLFIQGATFLREGPSGLVLAEYLDPKETWEISFIGQEVYIQSTTKKNVRIFAPQTEKVFFNGVAQSFIQDGAYISLTSDNKQEVLPIPSYSGQSQWKEWKRSFDWWSKKRN